MPPRLVFTGCYTKPAHGEGIHVFRYDGDTGRLTELHRFTDVDNPSFLALDAKRHLLFAVNEHWKDGAVSSFSYEPDTGCLSFLNRQPTLGGSPCHLCLDPAGHFLFVANHNDGSLTTLPVGADGRLGTPTDKRQHQGSGPGPTQKGPHAHWVGMDPTGKFVLCVDKGIDKVAIYRLQTSTGKLEPHEPFAALEPGTAPRHLAFGKDGKHAYVNGEAGMDVTVFAYDGSSAAFRSIQQVPTVPPGAEGKAFTTAEIDVHPSGRFLYVSNRGHNSLAVYEIGKDGRLAVKGHVSVAKNPRHFTFDSSGKWLYVASQDEDRVDLFAIDSTTGIPEPTGDVTPVGTPVCVLFA